MSNREAIATNRGFSIDVELMEKKIKEGKLKPENNPRITLSSQTDILDREDDRSYLSRQLKFYQLSVASVLNRLHQVRTLKVLGVSEPTLVRYIYQKDEDPTLLLDISREMDTLKLNRDTKLFANLDPNPSKIHYGFDDEENHFLYDLLDEGHLSIDEFFSELLRCRRETIGLMELQLQWLKSQAPKKERAPKSFKKPKPHKKSKNKSSSQTLLSLAPNTVEVTPADPQFTPDFEPPFLLSDWNVYWTRRSWSSNPNHYVEIPSTCREEMAEAIRKVGEGDISIKPTSIVRALEFHLFSRDVIKRALATRNRYAPEEEKDWVKVKRGRDRIGIYLPQEEDNTVVFFATGRDVAYRRL